MKKIHVLKNHSKIIKETIKVTPNKEETSSFDCLELSNAPKNKKYDIEFMFSANYECTITIYLCATECRNAPVTPLL